MDDNSLQSTGEVVQPLADEPELTSWLELEHVCKSYAVAKVTSVTILTLLQYYSNTVTNLQNS